MRRRNTLSLAVVLILLGAYVYFFELEKRGKEKFNKLLDFKEEEAEEISLSYPHQEIRFKKESSGTWKLTQPVQAPADESTIGSILSSLSTSDIKRTLEEKPNAEDLKGFGLDKPHVKVSITLRKGKALPPIIVGGKTPMGNSAYVQRGSEPRVLLTSTSLLSSLQKRLNDFRDKKIIDLKENDVRQFALNGTSGETVLTKRGGEWFIDKPRPYRADQAEVKGMLSTIRNTLAQDFLEASPSELKKYGLDKPRLQVTISSGEKEGRQEIYFGNKREGKNEVYLVLDSKQTVYTVYESVLKQLNKEVNALRDKEVFAFSRDNVFKLGIQTPKDSLILAKGEKEEWQMEAPKKTMIKPAIADDYLAVLTKIRAKGFVEDEPRDIKKYGLDSPSLKISLADREGKNLGTLLVGHRGGDGYYARREGNPSVFLLNESSYQQLNKQLSDFLQEEKT